MILVFSLWGVLILQDMPFSMTNSTDCDFEFGSGFNYFGEVSYQVSYQKHGSRASFLHNPPSMILAFSLWGVLILQDLPFPMTSSTDCDFEFGSGFNYLGEVSYQVSYQAWKWGFISPQSTQHDLGSWPSLFGVSSSCRICLFFMTNSTDCDFEFGNGFNYLGEVSYQVSYQAWKWGFISPLSTQHDLGLLSLGCPHLTGSAPFFMVNSTDCDFEFGSGFN